MTTGRKNRAPGRAAAASAPRGVSVGARQSRQRPRAGASWGAAARIALLGWLILAALAPRRTVAQSMHTDMERSPLIAILETDRSDIYAGETFVLYVTVYSDGPELAGSPTLAGLPDADTLAISEFEGPLAGESPPHQGRNAIRRYRCKARAPAAGRLTLTPAMRGSLLLRHSGLFSGVQLRELTIPIAPLSLDIRAVPEVGRPADYSGAVGQFALAVEVTPREVAVGDLVQVRISITGVERVPTLPLPSLPVGDAFRVYPVKPIPTDDPRVARFEGTIIPRSVEAREVGEVAFTYFDPRQRQFIRLAQGPFPVTLVRRAQPEVVAPAEAVRMALFDNDDLRALTGFQASSTPLRALPRVEARVRIVAPLSLAALAAAALAIVATRPRVRRWAVCATLATALTAGAAAAWLAASPARSAPATVEALAVTADEALAAGRAGEAMQGYAAVAAQGFGSPGLFLQWGRAAALEQRMGEAVVAYLRGLRLEPSNPALRTHVELAHRLAHAGFSEISAPAPRRPALRPETARARAATLAALAALTTLALGWRRRRAALRAAFLTAATLVATGLLREAQRWPTTTTPLRIATAETPARFAPHGEADLLFRLPAGAEARVTESQGIWVRVQTGDRSGWVEQSHLATEAFPDA